MTSRASYFSGMHTAGGSCHPYERNDAWFTKQNYARLAQKFNEAKAFFRNRLGQ